MMTVAMLAKSNALGWLGATWSMFGSIRDCGFGGADPSDLTPMEPRFQFETTAMGSVYTQIPLLGAATI